MEARTRKHFAVVGGATGIGEATVRKLVSEGADVVIGDVNLISASTLAQDLSSPGQRVFSIGCDVSQESSVKEFFSQASDKFGQLDGIHFNAADMAATRSDSDVVAVAMPVFDRILAVNLRGAVLCTKYAIPLLLENERGSIVYTSSRAAFSSEPTNMSYAVSKVGLHALLRHVALKWGKRGIRANAVAPGPILTEPLLARGPEYLKESELMVHTPTLGTPSDVASLVSFLLSNEADFINGQVVNIDGGRTMR